MHRKAIIECKKIIETVNENNFTEKADILLKTLKMPSHNIAGLGSVIAQANYMIGAKRNKLSDEELRYMLRYELISCVHQLKKYGPTSISMIGEETNVYKYHNYIGSLLEVKFQVEYYNNGYWDDKPVKVVGDMIKVLKYGGLSEKIPYIYETNKNIISKDCILNKISKKGDILVLYNNQLRNQPDKIIDLCLEAAKELGYTEVWVKTLDLYTYLWKCERVI